MLCYYCRGPLQNPEEGSYGYGVHEKCYLRWFNLSQLEEFTSIARRSHSTKDIDITQESWGASFFIGKFKKYSAALSGESYILKMKDDQAPELPEVEYLCNQIARLVGIPNPDFYFINFSGERTFVTKNFIRKGASVNLSHIHHYLPSGSREYNCEKIIQILLEQTKRLIHIETFIKTCLFDSLIGNGDRHSRNFGLLISSGVIELAPVYDNVSNLGLEQGEILKSDWNPTGKIATKATLEPAGTDYVREFVRLGYETVVSEWFEKIVLSDIKEMIARSFCSEPMKFALEKLVSKRYLEMNDEIRKRSQ